MSKKVTKLPEGFYSSLGGRHYYTAYDYTHLDNLEYDFDKLKEENCLQDGDLDLDKPLCVGFHYNANINWLVCGQEENLKMKTLNSFFVKYERKLRELV